MTHDVRRPTPGNLRKLRIGVIFGSRSVEHEVSVITALQAMDAMDPRRYEVMPIFVAKDGRWFTGPDLRRVRAFEDVDGLLARCQRVFLRPEPSGQQLYTEERGPLGTRKMKAVALDCVLPAIHGTFGEDGTLQGLLELADLPYVGAGVVGSAVGMDKVIMKAAFRAQGLPVVRYVWFTRARLESDREAVLEEIEASLRYPMFVKPANLGSSVGITTAQDRASLSQALEVASHYDRRLLVEEAVVGGREINCSVLGDDQQAQASVCEEPVRWTDLLSYEDKYIQGSKQDASGGMASAKRRIPADIGPERTTEIQRLAVEAFRAVDCAGVARIDFLLDEANGQVYVNEINTVPGSLSFYLWEPSGLSFPALIDRLIELARARHRDRRRTTFSYDSKLIQQFGRGGAKGKAGGERTAEEAPSRSGMERG
jgi:D-alanine-D-alanine ligase